MEYYANVKLNIYNARAAMASNLHIYDDQIVYRQDEVIRYINRVEELYSLFQDSRNTIKININIDTNDIAVADSEPNAILKASYNNKWYFHLNDRRILEIINKCISYNLVINGIYLSAIEMALTKAQEFSNFTLLLINNRDKIKSLQVINGTIENIELYNNIIYNDDISLARHIEKLAARLRNKGSNCIIACRSSLKSFISHPETMITSYDEYHDDNYSQLLTVSTDNVVAIKNAFFDMSIVYRIVIMLQISLFFASIWMITLMPIKKIYTIHHKVSELEDEISIINTRINNMNSSLILKQINELHDLYSAYLNIYANYSNPLDYIKKIAQSNLQALRFKNIKWDASSLGGDRYSIRNKQLTFSANMPYNADGTKTDYIALLQSLFPKHTVVIQESAIDTINATIRKSIIIPQ